MNIAPWYTNRVVWAGIVSMLSSAAMLTGTVITPDMQHGITDMIMQIVLLISGLYTIYGHLAAMKLVPKITIEGVTEEVIETAPKTDVVTTQK